MLCNHSLIMMMISPFFGTDLPLNVWAWVRHLTTVQELRDQPGRGMLQCPPTSPTCFLKPTSAANHPADPTLVYSDSWIEESQGFSELWLHHVHIGSRCKDQTVLISGLVLLSNCASVIWDIENFSFIFFKKTSSKRLQLHKKSCPRGGMAAPTKI